ncbi:MAG: hypothetical protein LCH61_01805 [Proteobacteria bacterium]|nr:hypothetical protein [Pseudomonadota bacterium]
MGIVKGGIAGILTVMMTAPVAAQQKVANIKAGQEVALYYVCKYGGGSASLSGTAANGTTRIASEASSRCGDKGEITRLFYKPNPGFRGTDIAYVYYWGQRWDITVNVR